jgi:hypothetical protein
MGLAPEATAKYLYLVVGSVFAILTNSVFSFFTLSSYQFLLFCPFYTSDKSSPRAYERMLVFDHRLLKFLCWNTQNFLVAIFDKST